jgi:uncharacterized protein
VYGADGACLRDLLLINAGCCLANFFGCGTTAVLLAPSTVRQIRDAGRAERGTRLADRMIGAVQVYQREISPKRPACCRFTPTCSHYAVEALQRHGAVRGTWLTGRRLVRCRPGARGRVDPVPF